MTATQRLQLEQLDLKKKLNALLGVDGDLTDEQRTEMDAHTKRLEQSDGELRAAIHAEGDDEARALAAHGTDGADGESAERRRLLEGVSLADYLTPASSGRGIEGRAAEVNAALEVPLAEQAGAWRCLGTSWKQGRSPRRRRMTAQTYNGRSCSACSAAAAWTRLGFVWIRSRSGGRNGP